MGEGEREGGRKRGKEEKRAGGRKTGEGKKIWKNTVGLMVSLDFECPKLNFD